MRRAIAFARRTGVLFPAVLLLGSCAVMRPPPQACPALPLGSGVQTVASSQSPETVESVTNAMVDALRAETGPTSAAETRASEAVANTMRAEARRRPGAPVTLRVITLSAGGQFGAFGAGFLEGWSRQPGGRPRFDVVTGVSAGAILAPVAFAGSEFDSALRFYRGLDANAVSTPRSILSLPGAPSIRGAGPLKAFLRGTLDRDLIAAMAARHAQGDRLLVSATNLDTTASEIFDLGAAARAGPPDEAADCITEALLASAAIPGILPPRHINGALYADGGLRQQVFFRAVDTARARVARETGRSVQVEAYLVVNGSLRPPETPVTDRLLDYIGRSVETLADEVLRDSITDALDFAQDRPGWRLRGILATTDFPECEFDTLPTGTFDPCITRTLYDHGVDMGSARPIAWLDAAALRALSTEL